MQQGPPHLARTRRLALSAAIAAGVLAAPAAADAAKYRGKASGNTITFNQKGKRISKVKTLIYVSCFASDGSGNDFGYELFHPPGKFRLGKESRKTATRYSAVRGGDRSFTYTVKPKRRSKTRIGGNLRLSYSDSTYDPFSGDITFWNCFGSTKFSAKKR
jgi:opacity protein-like surface antigen